MSLEQHVPVPDSSSSSWSDNSGSIQRRLNGILRAENNYRRVAKCLRTWQRATRTNKALRVLHDMTKTHELREELIKIAMYSKYIQQ